MGANDRFAPEEEVASGVCIYRSLVLLHCSDALRDISQAELFCAGQLWNGFLCQKLCKRLGELFSDGAGLAVIIKSMV